MKKKTKLNMGVKNKKIVELKQLQIRFVLLELNSLVWFDFKNFTYPMFVCLALAPSYIFSKYP